MSVISDKTFTLPTAAFDKPASHARQIVRCGEDQSDRPTEVPERTNPALLRVPLPSLDGVLSQNSPDMTNVIIEL